MSLGSSGYGRVEEEWLNLRSRVSELESRHNIMDQDQQRLSMKARTHSATTTVTVVTEDPQVEVLRRELKQLLNENRSLVQTIRSFRTTTTNL